jgi:hypothetical protein
VVNFSNGQIITIACRVLLKNLEAKQWELHSISA